MIPPISIDLGDVLNEFNLPSDIGEIMSDAVIKKLTYRFYETWSLVAGKELKSSRGQYLKSLQVLDEGKMKGAVILHGDLPNMIESGAGAFDMKCILNPHTAIYTSKGLKKIKDIKIGDLVLTHLGKFQRVSSLFKEENTEDFFYKLLLPFNEGKRSLYVTKNHPLLTSSGWKKAENLLKTDKLIYIASKCRNCGKLVPTYNIDLKKNIYCSKSCSSQLHNEFRKGKLRTDLSVEARKNISLAAIKTNKRLFLEGKHISQREDFYELVQIGLNSMSLEKVIATRKKIAYTLGKNNRNSDPESILWESIKSIPGITRQHLFIRDKTFKRFSTVIFHKYYFDFAIPEHKICIEVNGERFHTAEQDLLRKKEVEEKGWRYLSFWSQQIYKDLDNCIKEVYRVLDNHEDNYEFIEGTFTIEKVIRKKYNSTFKYKYNLTVENDSSYIANGIVTHNSGFSKSDKIKYTKDGGWYLTIPFRFSTPGSLGESEAFSGVLPTAVYNEAKKMSPTQSQFKGSIKMGETLSRMQVPKEFSDPKKRAAVSNLETQKTFEEYEHKTSIYAGMQRSEKTYQAATQSMFNTFRRVSSKSDPNSWIHQGMRARNLAEKAFSQFNITEEVDIEVDNQLAKLGFS